MLYLLLSTDGQIAPDGGRVLSDTMDRYLCHYSNARRIKVMQSMRKARASGQPFASFLQAFVLEAGRNKRALEAAFDCLVVAAGCDGTIDDFQMSMLKEACRAFGFPERHIKDTIVRFYDEHEEDVRRESSEETGDWTRYRYSRGTSSEQVGACDWAYKELGCTPGDDPSLIKKRYREAVRTLHPDSFIANKLTAQDAKRRASRFLEVQRAYEELSRVGVV